MHLTCQNEKENSHASLSTLCDSIACDAAGRQFVSSRELPGPGNTLRGFTMYIYLESESDSELRSSKNVLKTLRVIERSKNLLKHNM